MMVQVHTYVHTGIGVRAKVDYGNNAAMHVRRYGNHVSYRKCVLYHGSLRQRLGGEPGRGAKGWAVRCELMGGIGVAEDVIGRRRVTVQVSAN